MPDRYDIESMLIEQGQVLVRIESNQEHQSKEIQELSQSVKKVTEVQANCPARIQSTADELTARIQTPKRAASRPSLGPLPLPQKHEVIKYLPWVIATGIGIASALGWLPTVGTP